MKKRKKTKKSSPPKLWAVKCSGFDGVFNRRFATREQAEGYVECEDCIVFKFHEAPKPRGKRKAKKGAKR